ncbi:hypothetical protein, partial [Klebsiella pneumoniae]|uniref:hypothetical protein n=1 Tax=Klebsiella pneumoniae TaxID=573 RepID=UPI003A8363ED
GNGWIDVKSLANVFWHILKLDLKRLPVDERVSVLTSTERDRWALHRDVLIKGNERGVLEMFKKLKRHLAF